MIHIRLFTLNFMVSATLFSSLREVRSRSWYRLGRCRLRAGPKVEFAMFCMIGHEISNLIAHSFAYRLITPIPLCIFVDVSIYVKNTQACT